MNILAILLCDPLTTRGKLIHTSSVILRRVGSLPTTLIEVRLSLTLIPNSLAKFGGIMLILEQGSKQKEIFFFLFFSEGLYFLLIPRNFLVPP